MTDVQPTNGRAHVTPRDAKPQIMDSQHMHDVRTLQRQLNDVQTIANLQMAINDRLREQVDLLKGSNDRLREQLDAVRRDLAAERAKTAQLPPAERADIVRLAERVNALEDITYPQYELVMEEKPTRVDVKTLQQRLNTPELVKLADQSLAEHLNDGWTVLHIAIDAGDTYTIRIVTLTREVAIDATAGDDSDEAAPEVDDDPEIVTVAVPDLPLPRPFADELARIERSLS